MKTTQRGLTLIELMVVLSIIAVLSAVAYPSYQSHVRKTRRTDAHALLQAAMLGQEKYRLSNPSYAANFTDTAFSGVCRTVGTQCQSASGYYVLTVTAGSATASAYTLVATAQAPQTADTACPTITVTKTATDLTYGPSSTCWNK